MEVVSGILMLAGATLALIAGVGLQRFPDMFARMHAAKLLLVVVLQFITAPVGSHLIGRAAHRAGTELGDVVVDELADVPVDEPTRRP